MADIKLAKLPDRTPIRQVINLSPEQHRMLTEYAAFYAAEHGEAQPIADLIPAMLETFMCSDRAYLRAARDGRLVGKSA